MGIEIERKFLVTGDRWREAAGSGQFFRQGYLARGNSVSIRIRRVGTRAFLTLKSKRQGCVRLEFEYEIPVGDAEEILQTLCLGRVVEKTRYKIEHDDLTWEVDEFVGPLNGLVLAEVELNDPDQRISLPPWVANEVTNDHRYRNSTLARAFLQRDIGRPEGVI